MERWFVERGESARVKMAAAAVFDQKAPRLRRQVRGRSRRQYAKEMAIKSARQRRRRHLSKSRTEERLGQLESPFSAAKEGEVLGA